MHNGCVSKASVLPTQTIILGIVSTFEAFKLTETENLISSLSWQHFWASYADYIGSLLCFERQPISPLLCNTCLFWNLEMISGSCNIYIDIMGNAHIWPLSYSKISFLLLSENINLYVFFFILLASPCASGWFIMTNAKISVIMSYIILEDCLVSVVWAYRFREMFLCSLCL